MHFNLCGAWGAGAFCLPYRLGCTLVLLTQAIASMDTAWPKKSLPMTIWMIWYGRWHGLGRRCMRHRICGKRIAILHFGALIRHAPLFVFVGMPVAWQAGAIVPEPTLGGWDRFQA